MSDSAENGTVIVAEDDDGLREMLALALTRDGYHVTETSDGPQTLAAVDSASERSETVRLLILDIGLPGVDGLEVLTQVRECSDLPVIIITGRSQEGDRILGLDLGADDYVVKPIMPRELAARVRAVLRRTTPAPPSIMDFGDLVINPQTREVVLGEKPVDLAAREFDLLLHLATNPDQVHSREDLLRDVWRVSGSEADGATVTEHVRRLRLKIEDDPTEPHRIITVRRAGYRFAG